jgi:hypothetical protein
MKKNTEILSKIIGSIFFLLIILIWVLYTTYSWKLTNIISSNSIKFEICSTEIFSRDNKLETKIEWYFNENDLKVLELKCIEKFPNKRDLVISMDEYSNTFTISEENTIKENINIPKNTILKKSTMDIEFRIDKQNVTEGMTFFWYSIWKIQMRDATTRLWTTKENILKKSFTLDEIYYEGDDTQLIMTNMLWNDIQVSYNIKYYLENY